MRALSLGLATLGMALAAVPANAVPYTFSYGFGGTTFASGIIDTDPTMPCGPGCFVAGNVTGTNRGAAITGYDPFDLNSSQYVYPTTPGAYVDGSGLTYMVGSTSYTIYSVGSGNYNEFHFDTATGNQIGQSQFITSFTLAPAAVSGVPESSTWAMLILGMGLVGGALRRRTARVRFATAA